MTREEAIKEFEFHLARQNLYDDIFSEACKLAIEALQERPKGRWIELPCEIGDTVYFIDSPIPAVVDGIRIVEDGIIVDWVQYDKSYELTEVWDYGGFDATDIGETVFFTAEEAEKALADMRESEQ
jgi:hypothetical protein